MSEVDWAELQKSAATGGAIAEGDYPMICIEAEATESSNGKPMIKTKWRITEGPMKDRKVSTQFVISAESAVALKIFFQHMASLGLTTDFFATGPKMPEVASALVNRVAVVTLGIRPWQGVDRNEFKNLRGYPEGSPLPPGAVTGPATRIGFGGPATAPPSPIATTPTAPTPATPPTVPSAPPSSPF